ncbi:unnamed protein product [Cochlearia groenlandica]
MSSPISLNTTIEDLPRDMLSFIMSKISNQKDHIWSCTIVCESSMLFREAIGIPSNGTTTFTVTNCVGHPTDTCKSFNNKFGRAYDWRKRRDTQPQIHTTNFVCCHRRPIYFPKKSKSESDRCWKSNHSGHTIDRFRTTAAVREARFG